MPPENNQQKGVSPPLEGNASPPVPSNVVQPTTSPGVSPSPPANPSTTPPPPPPTNPPAVSKERPWNRLRLPLKKIAIIAALLLLVVASIVAAYVIGKSNERIIYQEKVPKPLSLPPQTIVNAECTPGRGKQYILPKDIPVGPIYDVVNSKVIAVEFNLDLDDIQSNPDKFPNTILRITREYSVDHFSVVPVTPKSGEALKNIHLIMYVVTKEEAAKITC